MFEAWLHALVSSRIVRFEESLSLPRVARSGYSPERSPWGRLCATTNHHLWLHDVIVVFGREAAELFEPVSYTGAAGRVPVHPRYAHEVEVASLKPLPPELIDYIVVYPGAKCPRCVEAARDAGIRVVRGSGDAFEEAVLAVYTHLPHYMELVVAADSVRVGAFHAHPAHAALAAELDAARLGVAATPGAPRYWRIDGELLEHVVDTLAFSIASFVYTVVSGREPPKATAYRIVAEAARRFTRVWRRVAEELGAPPEAPALVAEHAEAEARRSEP